MTEVMVAEKAKKKYFNMIINNDLNSTIHLSNYLLWGTLVIKLRRYS